MSTKNVLLVGYDGRVGAYARLLLKSANIGSIYAIPGHVSLSGSVQNIGDIDPNDIGALVTFAKEHGVDITLFASEAMLSLGAVDAFEAEGLWAFGPKRDAHLIEGSKAFAKNLMAEAGVPTAKFLSYSSYTAALSYVRTCALPVVIKADGLALGKGVYICKTLKEAEDALDAIMNKDAHRGAGHMVVIEEFLEGDEVSATVFVSHDSNGWARIKMMPTAQDHKRIGEGDTGLNTGGMGAIAPVPSNDLLHRDTIVKQTVLPILDRLWHEGTPFTGCLFPGLMRMRDGTFKVLEYNGRPGSPEFETISRLFDFDFLELLESCRDGTLTSNYPYVIPGYAASVVIAANGYPEPYKKGMEIFGIEDAEKIPGVVVYHMGTRIEEARVFANGGRLLLVTAIGKTLQEAIATAYAGVACIRTEDPGDLYFRRDIGQRALASMSH